MKEPGQTMAGRGVRVVRGSVTAAVAVLIAMLSHMAGGGHAPGVVGLVLAAAFAVPACILLAGRTVSATRLSVAVAGSQGVLHLLFSVGVDSPTTVQVVGGHHGAGGHVVTAGASADMAGMTGMHAGSAMPVAHVLAAVVTVIALRFGERAFWDVLAMARTSLQVVFRAVVLTVIPPVELRHRIARAFRVELRDLGVCVATTPRRGPPVRA